MPRTDLGRLSLIIDPLRHVDFHPVQGLGHADLAAQPRSLLEVVGQVQHVQLFVRGLVRNVLEVLVLEDEVASGAGQCAFTGPEAVNVHVVVDHDVQEVLSQLALGRVLGAVRLDEGYGHFFALPHSR